MAKKVPNFLEMSFYLPGEHTSLVLEGRRFCRQQKQYLSEITNKFLCPAPPEPGSSQAADVTFPVNSIAPWKNTCTPSQGQDPIQAATATADAVPNERGSLKIKVNCDTSDWEPGFFLSILGGEEAASWQQCPSSRFISGLKRAQSPAVPKPSTNVRAELHTSYNKSPWNRFWLICCNLLTSMSSLGLWQLAQLSGKEQFPRWFRQASAPIIATFRSRQTDKALLNVLL